MTPGRRTRYSLRLGRVAGIDIRVHVSFLLLLGLVAVGSTAPDGPGLAAGIGWLAALFACVVVHELAHSLVAQRHGINVTEIDLLPIGGVSRMTQLPEDPRVELRIAVAGPAASAALALVFGLSAALVGAGLWPPDLYRGDLLARLAWVNLLLAAFNLLPALPLDGGRVFRAVLEEHSDRLRATALAAQVARVLAVVMMITGVLVNVWLLLIGLFVFFGSRAEQTAAELHEQVKDLTVREVMLTAPTILHSGEWADQVSGGSPGSFPVIDENRTCVGLVTTRAIQRAAPGTRVGDLADRNAPVLRPEDTLEASGLLEGSPAVAVVVRDGRVVGLARAEDAQRRVRRLLGLPIAHPPPPSPPPPLPPPPPRRSHPRGAA